MSAVLGESGLQNVTAPPLRDLRGVTASHPFTALLPLLVRLQALLLALVN